MGTCLINGGVTAKINYKIDGESHFGSHKDHSKTKRFLCAYTSKNEQNKLNSSRN